MQVRVNGDTLELPAGTTLSELLTQLSLSGVKVAIELNREIVPRSKHETHLLQEGDELEIVHAIGGG